MQRFLSYENTILAVVMMVSFINPFTSSALTTALPGIGTAYGATDAQLSWVIELFLISSTVTIMPISKIADRIGKRHIFLFGVSLFCVSSLAVYFVNSLYGLFLLRILSCSSLAAMLNYCATFGISFLLSIYLQRITGLNARDTGLVLLIQPVLMALLSPVTGALSDRINPAVLASSGMILITFGLCLLAVDVSYPFFWLIALALVIIGIGFALFTAPNNNAIMGSVTPKYYGVASSVVSTVRLIGQVLSVAIITLILSQSGASAASDWLAQHIQQAFIVFTILCAIGIVPSAARSK